MYLLFFRILLYFCSVLYICDYNVTQQYKSDMKNTNNKSEPIQEYESGTSGGDEIVYRVINGREAEIDEVPYQVAIMIKVNKEEYTSICGGTIVASDKVISAAHCVVRFMNRIGKLNIVAGQLWRVTFYAMQGQWRQAKAVRFPESYKFPLADICLIELKDPYNFNKAVKAIPFATEFKDYNTTCKASGFGRTNKDDEPSSVLRVAFLKLLPNKQCDRIHRSSMSTFICTSDEFSDIYKGDSGGPLVCYGTQDAAEGNDGILVGVACAGSESQPMRTIFTRVSSFNDLLSSSSSISQSNCMCYYFVLFTHFIHKTSFLK